MTDIRSCKKGDQGQGISGDQNSAVGGAGRMGMNGDGSLSDPPKKDVKEMWSATRGMASGGQTGYGSGDGRTL